MRKSKIQHTTYKIKYKIRKEQQQRENREQHFLFIYFSQRRVDYPKSEIALFPLPCPVSRVPEILLMRTAPGNPGHVHAGIPGPCPLTRLLFTAVSRAQKGSPREGLFLVLCLCFEFENT